MKFSLLEGKVPVRLHHGLRWSHGSHSLLFLRGRHCGLCSLRGPLLTHKAGEDGAQVRAKPAEGFIPQGGTHRDSKKNTLYHSKQTFWFGRGLCTDLIV